MELIFRKHFWVVHGVFIFLLALMAARLVNTFVEAAIAPDPQVKARAAAAAVKPYEPPTALDGEKLAKLTGLPPPVAPAPVELAGDPEDLSGEPVKTSLRVRLLGTLVSEQPQWSFASIQDMNALKTGTYMVDDLILGAKVLEIERSRVIILNGGRKEFIDGEAGEGGPPPALATATPVVEPRPTVPGSKATGSGIRATGENEYEVPRPEIDKTLSNLNDVAMQARIVPAFQDGVAKGFKLFSIRPDSIYTKIGVQNGDIIRRINGYDLNSPEKALEVYSKLKEASRIDIELERNGSVVRKTYNIR
jgi:general secretion pathway protein C